MTALRAREARDDAAVLRELGGECFASGDFEVSKVEAGSYGAANKRVRVGLAQR